jgi:hypothetical protein
MNTYIVSLAIYFLLLERIAQLFFSIRCSIKYRAQSRADAIYVEEMADPQWAEFSDEVQHER